MTVPRLLNPERLALAPLVLATTVLALTLELLLHELAAPPLWTAYLYGPIGLLYVLAGAAAMGRRPTNRLGVLLALAGVIVVISGFVSVGPTGGVIMGSLVVTLPLGLIAHLLHAFPSGRLRGRPERMVVGATYVVTFVIVSPAYFLLRGGNPLSLADKPDVADVLVSVNGWLFVTLTCCSALILAVRLRALAPERRRVVGPLYLYGVFTLLMFSFAPNVLPKLVAVPFTTIELLQLAAASGVPLVFLVTIVRGGYARAASAETLAARLAPSADATQEALAAGLGDPSIRLHDVAPAQLGRDRALLPITVDGRALGAIEYDATQMTDLPALEAAGAIVAVSQERARLIDELRDASERMVRAADQERARIARDLHDGLQARLVLLALQADGDDTGMRESLVEAVDDLRAFVQGIMPAGLIERGLEAAVEDLADRLPLACDVDIDVGAAPLPAGAERTAYFVVAEALTNAVKHSGAERLRVQARRDGATLVVRVEDDGRGGARADSGGTGLVGLGDRLAALRGTLEIASAHGAGTWIEAVIPCAS